MPPVSADLTKFRLAPAAVFYDGVYVGEVSYDTAVEITDDVKDVPMRSARLGRVNAALVDHDCYVTVPVVEVDPTRLALAIPGASLVGGLLTVSYTPGTKLRPDTPKQLQVIALDGTTPSTDPDDILTFPDASPAAGTIKQTFNASKQQEFIIKFQVWPNTTTGELWTTGS